MEWRPAFVSHPSRHVWVSAMGLRRAGRHAWTENDWPGWNPGEGEGKKGEMEGEGEVEEKANHGFHDHLSIIGQNKSPPPALKLLTDPLSLRPTWSGKVMAVKRKEEDNNPSPDSSKGDFGSTNIPNRTIDRKPPTKGHNWEKKRRKEKEEQSQLHAFEPMIPIIQPEEKIKRKPSKEEHSQMHAFEVERPSIQPKEVNVSNPSNSTYTPHPPAGVSPKLKLLEEMPPLLQSIQPSLITRRSRSCAP